MHGSNAQRLTKLKKSVTGLRVQTPKFRVRTHRDLKKRFEAVTGWGIRTATVNVRMLGLAIVAI